VFPPNNGVRDVIGPCALIAGTLIECTHCWDTD
jgi:hypothetical protein